MVKMALVLTGTLAALSVQAAGTRTFTVDPGRSRAVIDVGKTGALSLAGHTHARVAGGKRRRRSEASGIGVGGRSQKNQNTRERSTELHDGHRRRHAHLLRVERLSPIHIACA